MSPQVRSGLRREVGHVLVRSTHAIFGGRKGNGMSSLTTLGGI